MTVLLAMAGPAGASAPDSLGLRAGDRVRISDRHGRHVYVLRGQTIDSLALEPLEGDGTRSMRFEEASCIEVGALNSRAAGAFVGTCLGAVVVAAGCAIFMDGETLTESGPASIAAGAILGGVIGALRPGTRWEIVYGGRPPGTALMSTRAPLMFDSTGADVLPPHKGLRLHFNIGLLAGYDSENAPMYEPSRFRFMAELGLKFLRPFPAIERIESVAIAYSLSGGETGYEVRNSVGPTVSLRVNDRWTGNLMAGPLWFRSTNDFGVGVQCRGYFVYRKIFSCEALLNAVPPTNSYRAAGGEWQTSLYAGIGLHGSPGGGVFVWEAFVGAAMLLSAVALFSILSAD